MTPNTPTWRKSSYSENGGVCVEIEISSPTWQTSSHSENGGACVQVATWTKSSHSDNGGACVEISATPAPVILIRDSKALPHAPTLHIPAPAFTTFLTALKTGTP
ncbi:DUF397 domain-containing protein [Streptomyces roseirectus]|uniref:DUF397 domain-containing protein n=1 Tax=Streptomyces roseirectus TaxID=2768066 RepID=A0A7H0IFE0_9ACTN|nr:DUF397 domain-containing protein [Streptomyces roseirectus]QNP71506.1 DUF397 domain-containing protein [Streptomyces roseirectus]